LGSITVVADTSTSIPIPPGQQLALTIGANLYLAAVTEVGYSDVSVAVGA
jgi:hypothetical protein